MKSIAIIGAGGIAGEHADALMAQPERWTISHVCDLNAAQADALAARTGAQPASLEAILADPEIDVIDICLPPALHVEIAIKGLAAGKDVVCEKPIACSLAEAAALQSAVETSGRRVFPVFQYRYGAAFRRLRALQNADLLGPARVATFETHWNRNADYYAVPWRGTWAYEKGGAVLCHAIHIHDLACELCGPVVALSAATDTLINPVETEDCAAILMRSAGGCLTTSSVTLGAARDESRLRIVFQNATVESERNPYAPGQGVWTITARDPSMQAAFDAITAPAGEDGFRGYFADVSDALEGRANTAVTLQHGVRSIELVTAIYEAAKTGQTIHLPVESGSRFFNGWQPATDAAEPR